MDLWRAAFEASNGDVIDGTQWPLVAHRLWRRVRTRRARLDRPLVLLAVRAGEGIAFGWRHITERGLRQGLLERITGHVYETGEGFFLVWSVAQRFADAEVALGDWIPAGAGRAMVRGADNAT